MESGLSGIPIAEVVKSIVTYKICINSDKDENVYHLIEPIQLPSNQAIKFDTELYEKLNDDEIVSPQGRRVLFFTFEFSNDIKISIPRICLNCKSENELLKIYRSG